MQLSAEQQRFLWIGQGLVPFVINVVLNAGIAWAMFRGAAVVPLWGASSIGGDTLATSFLLPAITCLIVTPLVRAQVRKGEAPAFTGALAGWLAPFRRSLAPRAVAFGLACVPVAGGITVAVLVALGVESLGFASFVGFKAAFAGLLAACITPAIALVALADPSGR
jgi:hypothetical protein